MSMRPTVPRIDAIEPRDFTDEQAGVVGGRDSPVGALNISRTLVHHPLLFRSWMPFAGFIGLQSSLPPREREIFVLRILALCGETYELSHHLVIARKAGLTTEEIAAARVGAGEFSEFEQVLLRAAEELVREQRTAQATWSTLAQRYTNQQMLEVLFTAGMYIAASVVTNSVGIQPEADIEQAWKPVTSGR